MSYNRDAFILFILGIFLIGASAFFGQGKIMLFFFIPVFYGAGIFAFLGILCIIASVLLMFYSITSFSGIEEEYLPVKQERKVKGGGIVFIGPVPIIFGSDTKVWYIMFILALIVIGMMILFWILIY